MICALWAVYAPQDEKTQIFLYQSAKEFVVTWKAERYQWFGEGYRPLGPNVFQARLTPDGSIALGYQKISEKDGIVGLFPGGFASKPLASLPKGFVQAAAGGGTLRFSFEIEKSVPVPHAGTIWYRVYLAEGLNTCEIGVEWKDSAQAYFNAR